MLQSTGDPRLPYMSEIFITEDTTSADQVGLPPGFIVGGANPATDITKNASYNPVLGMEGYSRFNDNILSYTAPNLILTYSETEFLLADAAKRWGITTSGTAAQHYANGVLAAITQLSAFGDASTIDPSLAQAYLTNNPYNDADGLNQINTQYWRRTGFPVLTPTNYTGNVTAGTIPRRLEYPTSEKVTNGTNYNAAVARLTGGDLLTSRMWWDTP
jgi:Starch-binding associating with outer membrane